MSDHSEIQALSQVLDALYQSVTEARGWENFKLALSEWLGATACEFYSSEAIGLPALVFTPPRAATTESSTATHEYTALAPVGDRRVGLSIYRPADAPSFNLLERGRLDIVASHLAQAIALRRVIDKKETIMRGARTAFEHVPTSVALLGRRGEARHYSEKFKSFAADSAYLSLLDGHIVLRDPARQAQLLDHLGALSPRSAPPLTFFLEANGKDRVYATVRSVLGTGFQTEWPTVEAEAAVAVLILEGVPAVESPDAIRIADAMGISPAQARLVAALINGKSVKEYAFEAGISVHTARTHLKKVFTTLGVKSQAALSRMVLIRTRSSGSIE